ncbi:type I restriction enzyme HsdR N-terminal domain-containing protein [Thalassotalea euphylliae]|nr:type I restriction enzyme HsdR N-terminal domain-containing protein [Thalassotalea euphylliae]
MFKEFDFSILNDLEYKEDAVREDIVKPILTKLGYTPSGNNKMIRSRSLEHPFVYIGSQKRKINIIPDYVLEVSNSPKLILDAKGPNEDILKGKNVEQAFSYAIHPDIRVRYYALCNGRQLSIFDVTKRNHIAIIDVNELDENWDTVHRLLSPIALTKPELLNFKPDYGMYMLKAGAPRGQRHHFEPMGVPMIAKVEDNLYTICVNIGFGEDYLATSFDFGKKEYKQLLSCLPKEASKEIRNGLRRQPYRVLLEENTPEVCIDAILGSGRYSNENEEYIPLIVERFRRYVKQP